MARFLTLPLVAGLVLAVLVGFAVGIGFYTFVYAKGSSYLTNDPRACANCHIMSDHFAGWVKSPHHGVASCNDCHTPHGLLGKYVTKASNGFWHSYGFTTGRFPEPIRIKPRNRAVTERACRHCHAEVTEAIAGPHRERPEDVGAGGLSCVKCHDSVGHPH